MTAVAAGAIRRFYRGRRFSVTPVVALWSCLLSLMIFISTCSADDSFGSSVVEVKGTDEGGVAAETKAITAKTSKGELPLGTIYSHTPTRLSPSADPCKAGKTLL